MPECQAVVVFLNEMLLDAGPGALQQGCLLAHERLEDVVVGAGPGHGEVLEKTPGIVAGTSDPL